MSVYMIIEALEIMNPEKYGEYQEKVPKTIEKFGGKYLVRGGKLTVASGQWHPARLVLVEFASMKQLKAWWNSPEYRKIAPLREQSAKINAVIVEGI